MLHIPEKLNMTELVLDRRVAEGNGNRVAIFDEGGRITYSELLQQVNRCGNALRRLGIGRGDYLLIRSYNRPEYAVVFLAAMKLGAVPIPTNSLFRSHELQHIINNSGVKVAMTTSDLCEPIVALKKDCPPLQHIVLFDGGGAPPFLNLRELLEKESDVLDVAPTSKDDVAFSIYTSGTTGEPKGIEHAHRWIIATGDSISKTLMRLTPSDICYTVMEISFIYALGCNLLFPLYSGAAVAFSSGRFDPEKALKSIQKYRATIFVAVPTVFRRILALEEKALQKYDLSSLTRCFSSGEPLPVNTYTETKRRLGVEIFDSLGQTEIHIFMNSNLGSEMKPGALGKPLPGHRVTILDDEGKEAQSGEIGHLVIKADDPGLSLGYKRRPEIWNATIKDGWYYTQDLAYRDENGLYWYVSRSDDLIKSRAYLISPREVEAAAMEHPAVLEAAVVGLPDEVIGKRVKAFITLKPSFTSSDALAREITQQIGQRIAPYKVPKEIEFVQDLPKTSTGKIKRRELRKVASPNT
ncbi:MAG: benzoate-CoA ligase family protein [Acidobacteria bacterium]|nr:benzoate-CoA ligase family protein [Acidobacteriota bacterium]